MKLTFRLEYKTDRTEKLYAVLYRQKAILRERKMAVPLSSTDGNIWRGEASFSIEQPLNLYYHYEVRQEKKILRHEWHTTPRLLKLDPASHRYFLSDQWRDLPSQFWPHCACMTDVFRNHPSTQALPLFERTLILRAQTPYPGPDEEICLCGDNKDLGNWDTTQAIPLVPTAPNEWSVALNAAQLHAPFEYKFIVRNTRNGKILWEDGPNHRQEDLPTQTAEVWQQNDLRPQFPDPVPFRAAGVVLPVFSLRSQNSWGVGDFGDLLKLTDWTALTGQKVVQILPINDTSRTNSWQDSYPYNAISVYAFHPLYADMNQLPPLSNWRQKSFEKARQKLNALPQLDYESVLQLKLKRLHLAFKQEGKTVLASQPFLTFWNENVHWLPAYAMFCTLRDKYHTADFTSWPHYSVFSPEDLRSFCAPGAREADSVRFWYYVQFVLHTQLLKAARYARKRGVILKGDIPIGISSHSVDTWTDPDLFNLNAQAGAPPDDFSATGQNWGFPTYNWEAMERSKYRWWIRRLTHMARYFDAYRIDHVLGFFRIWEIPQHAVDGLLGQFVPALPLSLKEIASYGLTFQPEFARPYISQALLDKLFGEQTADVVKKFLYPLENGLFQLRPQYATQRQIQAALAKYKDEKTNVLRQGLYALAANVLFVLDRNDPSKFHPRIAALSSSAFTALSEADKKAFARLYNDYFFHRHNDFWAQEALKKLPVLTRATRMLCCAEDLGMVPACVPQVMEKLQMLSLEIQRMPKELSKPFADIQNYPYLSVATPSTHDMSVLRGWWKEEKSITQLFWTDVLHQPGQAPVEANGKTCEDILKLHLQSASMLALISFQDWTSIDENLRAPDPAKERINIPADPHHLWRYRMPISLETLREQKTFNNKIKEMIKQAGR